MSVHRKKGDRHEADFYSTPLPLVEKMVEIAALWAPSPETVLEPGCSTAAPFLAAARKKWPEAAVLGIDFLPKELAVESPAGAVLQFETDYLTWEAPHPFDLVITNPPFSLAEEFLLTSLRQLTLEGIAVYLLRLGWLGSQGRYKRLHGPYPPRAVYVLPARPSFTSDNGTDAEEYAIYIYGASPANKTELAWAPWDKPKKRR